MTKSLLRIATRQSKLALWQANDVKSRLENLHPGISIELIGITTSGDIQQNRFLNDIGGKGLFVKELEEAILDHRADIAVHSMKDVPAEFPDKLGITTMMEREDPRDALVLNHHQTLSTLPSQAKIGTSSLRRRCQLLHVRPDLKIEMLRGNVDSRLNRLDQGEFDAIILASAGLKRLGLAERITEYLSPDIVLPACGQGAIGIEHRLDDETIRKLLHPLNHTPTALCVAAERAMTKTLGGGCHVPIAAYAIIENKQLTLQGLVGDPQGRLLLRAEKTGSLETPETLGQDVAQELLRQGAKELLSKHA